MKKICAVILIGIIMVTVTATAYASVTTAACAAISASNYARNTASSVSSESTEVTSENNGLELLILIPILICLKWVVEIIRDLNNLSKL